MKKTYLLLILLISIVGCEKEEVNLLETKGLSKIETVSKEDVNNFIKTEFNSSKKSGLTLYPEQIYLDTLKNSDESLTIIPAQSKYSNVNSRILLLKVNGKIKQVVFNMISTSEESDEFTGRIIVTDLDGNFLTGYRLVENNFVTQYVKKNSSNKSSECDPNYGSNICDNMLEEVIITTKPSSPVMYLYLNIDGSNFNSFGLPAMTEPTWYFDGGSGGTVSTITTAPIKIINELDNICASLIFNQMYLSSLNTKLPEKIRNPDNKLEVFDITNGILALFNQSSLFDYTINNRYLSDKNASTIGASTTLSTDYLNKATQLSIARTMIHEMVHAYLNLTTANSPQIDNTNFYDLMMAFARENGFNPSGTEYERNKFQHEFMGGYVKAMAYSLFKWDINHGTRTNLGWDYYYKMATAGLIYKDNNGIWQDTDAFNALFDEVGQSAAKKIINNEANNSRDAKGSDC